MRTTLTIDDDVAAELSRIRRQRQIGLKDLINQTLRAGLQSNRKPERMRAPFRTPKLDLGRCLVGSVDDVAEALALGEGEDHR